MITPYNQSHTLEKAISNSWLKISPFWPLKNIIAVNPVAGLEELSFEESLKQASLYFQQTDLPKPMQNVNRESIKWLQAFFDQGQSTINMPHRHLGFLRSTLSLIKFDKQIHLNNAQKLQWVQNLPEKSELIIAESLLKLNIPTDKQEQFLTLMLTTLSGWAAYIQYRTNWADKDDATNPHTITQSEYLAFRLIITFLIWPDAKELMAWHQNGLKGSNTKRIYNEMAFKEKKYQNSLLKKIQATNIKKQPARSKAQVLFCIDVRSEPFRRALEAQGNYDTYGLAGFFGLPISIKNAVTDESYSSCPVLLKPVQSIIEYPICSQYPYKKQYRKIQTLKKLYQSMKYTFTTPFNLVEAMGIGNGIWMALRSLLPNTAGKIQSNLKRRIVSDYELTPDIKTITLEQQVAYGASTLKMIGLTENFAPLVVFCSHGSTTQNNAYASSLECGACGGRHGDPNARILAKILNKKDVRKALANQGILVPDDTAFIAAKHNTTTDEVKIYADSFSNEKNKQIASLKKDLKKAREENSIRRAYDMGVRAHRNQAQKTTSRNAQDWAQVRPEWGLARNAAFIVAPRSLTAKIDLEGRSFLHSYEWEKDHDCSSLTTILTAPMVVTQWINAQYLFSTLDNVAFGGGSKITTNITGKIGIMQGNASDLMNGLPLQSVYKSDKETYHKAMRLTVIIYAPKTNIDLVIKQHRILQKLFGNGWIHLICYDPNKKQKFKLQRELKWTKLH